MFRFLRFLKNAIHGPAIRRPRARGRPPTRFRPHLEPLEDRLAPATHVWSGAVSSSWRDAGNWSSGGSPQGDPDATLVFPSGAARFTSTNDLSGFANITQITVRGNGYLLNGGVIDLQKSIVDLSDGNTTIDFQGITFKGTTFKGTSTEQGFINSFGSTLNVRSPIAGGGTIPLTVQAGGRKIILADNVTSAGMNLLIGTLVVTQNTSLGSGPVTMFFGPTIESSASVTLANRLIVRQGGSVGGGNNIRFTGNVQIDADAGLSVFGSGSHRFDGIVFGPGTLRASMNPDGLLDLAGNNTHEGGTEISGGVVRVEHNNALGRGRLTLADFGTLSRGSGGGPNITLPNRFEVHSLFSTPRINNAVGELTLSGPGTLTGNLEVTGGTVDIVFPLPPPVIVRLSGALSGPGGLTMAAQSGLSLGNYTLILSGSGANSYAGTTTVNGGTLVLNKPAGVTAIAGPLVIGDDVGGAEADVVELRADEQIADDVPITLNDSGLLRLNGKTETYGSLEGPNDPNSRVTLSTMIVGRNNRSTTFAGVISGPGSVTKVGTGTWTLTGANTYTGGTVVSGGTLLVNGSLVGTVAVNAGATLGGTGTTGPVALSAGAAVSPGGAAPGIQRMQNLAFAAGSSFVVQLNGLAAGTGYDQLDVTGSVSLNGATLNASLGFSPAPGDSFVIIKNDGTDPVAGTFAGLPQGASLRIGGVAFHIYYDRGDGNDVALVRNVPPAVTRPGNQTAFQNVDLALSGIGVADPEDAHLTITLQVSHGTLTLGTVAGLTVGGNGTSAVSLSGSQAALNAALAGLIYRAAHNYSGPDTLTVTASDGLDSTSASVPIRVKSLAEQAADLQAQVNALRAAGVLNQGQANSLLVKLELRNNPGDIGRVQSFLNEVDALRGAGVLSPAQADALLGAGNVLLTGLRRR